jgi:hypothetical protein
MKKARKLLCTSHIGCLTVELWADPHTFGGRCSPSGQPWGTESSRSAHSGCGCIEIGLADDDWEEVVNSLLHEAFEFYATVHGLSYRAAPSYSSNSDMYLFIMTHPQMAECFGAITPFISKALPELAKQYKDWNKHV